MCLPNHSDEGLCIYIIEGFLPLSCSQPSNLTSDNLQDADVSPQTSINKHTSQELISMDIVGTSSAAISFVNLIVNIVNVGKELTDAEALKEHEALDELADALERGYSDCKRSFNKTTTFRPRKRVSLMS